VLPQARFADPPRPRDTAAAEGCGWSGSTLAPGGETHPVVTEDGRVHPVLRPWRFPADFEANGGAGERDGLTLELRSPTFVRRGAEPRGTLAFADVVDDLLRRVSLLGQGYADGPVWGREREHESAAAAARAVEVADAAVRWLQVPRYSRKAAARCNAL
jgi:hypothetical protein